MFIYPNNKRIQCINSYGRQQYLIHQEFQIEMMCAGTQILEQTQVKIGKYTLLMVCVAGNLRNSHITTRGDLT